MVQRKVPNKLGIQADIHVKSEKRLGSLKPSSSCQHQDGKNKATTDLKKKMKRTRSLKLSDMEGLRSSPVTLRTTMAQPGKPPPLNYAPPAAAASATTSQKKSAIKAVDGSPNYMKSTSSSEAKKETSLVSSRITQTASDSKINLRRRSSTSSKISPASANKPARNSLTRTSSLKLVRTLTKSPSFKPARKCSRVALCADMNVQKATCSSTLKDSKFPAYLMLNPGGTESEGTSIIKVCPYTYCSLNGHHHTPLPPLKCFLRARRRSLKTQRSTKMEALNPQRQKPCVAGAEELDNKPTSIEVDLDNSPTSPLMREGDMDDFFIEIYAKSKGNDAEENRGNTEMNAKGMDDFGCANETAPEHDTDKPVSESLSEGSPHSEIDFDENLEGYGEFTSKDDATDATENLHEALKENGAEEDFRGILGIEESPPWKFNDGDKQECLSSIYVDHTMFEVIDMEWDGWQYSASEPDDEACSSMQTDDESDLNIGDSSKSDRLKELVISSNASDSVNITDEILADGAEQEVFEEDTASIDISSQVSETLSFDQVSSTEEMSEVLEGKEDEEEGGKTSETDLTGIVTTPSSMEELSEGQTSGKEEILENGAQETVNEVSQADSQLEIPENSCIIDVKDEVLESTEKFHSFEDCSSIQKPGDLEENETFTISDFSPEKELPSEEGGGEDRLEESKVADAKSLVGIQISDLSHVLSVADEEEDAEQVNDNQNNNASDAIMSTLDKSLFAESQDHLSDSQHENTYIVVNKQSILEEDQDEAVFKVPTSKNSEEPASSRKHDSASAEYDVVEKFPITSDKTSQKSRSTFNFSRGGAKKELLDDHNNRRWTIGRRRQEENEDEESRKFNPREPNFLPVVPEPEAEKVDLRHLMMDERKNAEEWMLDHALQQAVTKLAPARKRKVALLVEAFETVLPTTKCETHLRHTSTDFGHGQPIQACN